MSIVLLKYFWKFRVLSTDFSTLSTHIYFLLFGYGYGDGMVKDVLRDSPGIVLWTVTRTTRNRVYIIIRRNPCHFVY
nr:MAG TPA: hypothetical protein [Caudoviricetes sp.]